MFTTLRANLWRMNPAYWWEVIDYRTHIHPRVHAIRAALNWRLSEDAIESIYNAHYFQYAINCAENRGRGRGADYIESLLKYGSAERAIESLRDNVEIMDALHEDAWKNRSALYFPGGETIQEAYKRKAAANGD